MFFLNYLSAINASTAESPTMVNEFLSKLATNLRVRAAQDFSTMSDMKRADTKSEAPLAAWDTPYYTAKYKKQFLQVSSSEFTPYFSLGGCMEGLNHLMKCLYGISLENTEMGPGDKQNILLQCVLMVDNFQVNPGQRKCINWRWCMKARVCWDTSTAIYMIGQANQIKIVILPFKVANLYRMVLIRYGIFKYLLI